ncbi:MAG TPA: diadenylate cyclase CdaA [Deinococcales bacterium]|nr:diadenylate cyclase CdaA [Deinococcales bacterium]
MRLFDIIDILLVATLLYQGYKLVVGTRAVNLVRGLVIFALAWYAATRLGLATVSFILGNLATVGFFALVVVFQPELRSALERIGRSRVREVAPLATSVGEVARAVERLAERRVGALIAMERGTPLGEHARTGVAMDAVVSAPTLETIFARNTPLHDGGVVISQGRIIAANCLFPLQSIPDGVYRRYGTRHRAALGLSDVSDALVVVVSEERGAVRVAQGGQLSPDLSPSELRERLREAFYEPAAPWYGTLDGWPWSLLRSGAQARAAQQAPDGESPQAAERPTPGAAEHPAPDDAAGQGPRGLTAVVDEAGPEGRPTEAVRARAD